MILTLNTKKNYVLFEIIIIILWFKRYIFLYTPSPDPQTDYRISVKDAPGTAWQVKIQNTEACQFFDIC